MISRAIRLLGAAHSISSAGARIPPSSYILECGILGALRVTYDGTCGWRAGGLDPRQQRDPAGVAHAGEEPQGRSGTSGARRALLAQSRYPFSS